MRLRSRRTPPDAVWVSMLPDVTITFYPRLPGNVLPVRLLAKAGTTIQEARMIAFRSAPRMHADPALVEILSDDGETVRELWEVRDGAWAWAGKA